MSEADVPDPDVYKRIRNMVTEIAEGYGLKSQEAEAFRYIEDGKRLLMTDEHPLYKVFEVLIQDGAFRLALTAGAAAIAPDVFVATDQDEFIMQLSFYIATIVAATGD